MVPCEIFKLSSLAKVFPEKIHGPRYEKEIVCKGESLSFQIAIRVKESKDTVLYLSHNSDFEARLYTVGYVPSEFPAYPISKCRKYITKKPGLFPDPLFPLENGRLTVKANILTSVFVTVKLPKDCDAGEKEILLTLSDENSVIQRVSFSYQVLDAVLPPQGFAFTQWFHADCIANVHGVRVLSEKHWALMEKYMKMAGEHGITSILTPIFTPPLDTAVGGERTTIQLVSIIKKGDDYQFDFSALKRFTALARKAGIPNIEIAHLFTQWGAEHAPKIIVEVDGKKRSSSAGKRPPARRNTIASFGHSFPP